MIRPSGWRRGWRLLVGIGAVTALFLYPGFAMVVMAGLLLTLQTGVAFLPVIARRLPPAMPPHADAASPVWLSVHVPIHAEPPHIVLATLRALQRQQNAPPHEIIVLDNNTADPAIWQPVRDWCRTQGGPFRFHHREGVRGAKAGALNIALALSDPRCTHVVVVDADYITCRDFLRTAQTALTASGADFIQFPQAFEAGDRRIVGLTLELSDYFRRQARIADQGGAMLLTGTLSVIAKPAIEAIGGWCTRTATEDAETGLALLRAGFRGRYVDRVVGRGLMALDLDGLKAQRARWARGNMRTLMLGMGAEMRRPCLDMRQRVMIAMQLTAWINLALPAGLLACLSPLLHHGGHPQAAHWVAILSLASLTTALMTGIVPLMRLRARSASVEMLAVLLATRLALQPSAAVATLAGIGQGTQGFLRTAKIACPPSSRGYRVEALFLPVMATLAGIALLGLSGVHMPSIAAMAAAGALPLWAAAQAVSDAALRHYAFQTSSSPAGDMR